MAWVSPVSVSVELSQNLSMRPTGDAEIKWSDNRHSVKALSVVEVTSKAFCQASRQRNRYISVEIRRPTQDVPGSFMVVADHSDEEDMRRD